jgi:hypothetical protein
LRPSTRQSHELLEIVARFAQIVGVTLLTRRDLQLRVQFFLCRATRAGGEALREFWRRFKQSCGLSPWT